MFQSSSPEMHRNASRSTVQPLSRQQVASWLLPDEIILDTELHVRRHALEAAADIIARKHGLDAAPIFRALWRRELVVSTALGQGVAIPHARIEGIDRPITVFLRPRRAIDFDAPDGKPVRSILAILVPANGDTDDHLALLAQVAEMFADGGFRRSVANAGSIGDVADAFSRWTGTRGLSCRD